MAKNLRTVLRALSAALACAFTVACGGGGGGTSGGGSSIPSAYTGSQAQATIGQGNAEEIALSAYSGGTLGTALTDAPPLGQPAAAAAAAPSTGVGAILSGAVRKMNLGSPAARPLSAEAISERGPCGGRVTGTIDGAIVGSFTGHLNFEGYCDGSAFYSGGVQLSGTQNPGTGEVQIVFTFNGLSVTAQDDAYRVDGPMSMNLNRNTPDVTTLGVNLVLTEGGTGKTQYMAYTLVSTARAGSSENVLSGRYYAHDHGYVDLATETPVRVPQGESLPESGALRFTGAGGTWAKLTFDGFGIYRIDTSDGGYIPRTF